MPIWGPRDEDHGMCITDTQSRKAVRLLNSSEWSVWGRLARIDCEGKLVRHMDRGFRSNHCHRAVAQMICCKGIKDSRTVLDSEEVLEVALLLEVPVGVLSLGTRNTWHLHLYATSATFRLPTRLKNCCSSLCIVDICLLAALEEDHGIRTKLRPLSQHLPSLASLQHKFSVNGRTA